MRVGTRYQGGRTGSRRGDHPHACGDKGRRKPSLTESRGSSPCVWGQVSNDKTEVLIGRIIPMRVGTSWSLLLVFSQSWDHPHACGDKL